MILSWIFTIRCARRNLWFLFGYQENEYRYFISTFFFFPPSQPIKLFRIARRTVWEKRSGRSSPDNLWKKNWQKGFCSGWWSTFGGDNATPEMPHGPRSDLRYFIRIQRVLISRGKTEWRINDSNPYTVGDDMLMLVRVLPTWKNMQISRGVRKTKALTGCPAWCWNADPSYRCQRTENSLTNANEVTVWTNLIKSSTRNYSFPSF